MQDENINIGFVIDGLWHLTPKESCEQWSHGAVIVDVREEYMNRLIKRQGMPEVAKI